MNVKTESQMVLPVAEQARELHELLHDAAWLGLQLYRGVVEGA